MQFSERTRIFRKERVCDRRTEIVECAVALEGYTISIALVAKSRKLIAKVSKIAFPFGPPAWSRARARSYGGIVVVSPSPPAIMDRLCGSRGAKGCSTRI